MKHAVTQLPEPFSICDGAGRVHLILAWQDNLIWVLECVATGEAAVIDGPEAGPTLAYCERKGLNLKTILNTHTHPDHIGINKDLLKRGLLDDFRVVGNPDRPIPGLNAPVSAGDTVMVGALTGQVILTEGHQDGHLTYRFGDAVFCGDVLFGGGCGYLFDGPPAKMYASLMTLAAMPADTQVFCAHEYTQDNLRFAWSVDPENAELAERIRRDWATRAAGGCTIPTTIGLERATNPFMRPKAVKARVDASLSDPGAIFAATRKLKDGRGYKSMSEDALPL